MQRVALIVAMSENGVIGNHNALPWCLPEELKYFKEKTLGKPVIMGRKTFESMGSKPLSGRRNIILTHTRDFTAAQCKIVHSMEEALKVAGASDEIMIIGGAKVYESFLPVASRFYLTLVNQHCVGDTYFPKIDWSEWKIMSEEKHEKFTLKIFDRII